MSNHDLRCEELEAERNEGNALLADMLERGKELRDRAEAAEAERDEARCDVEAEASANVAGRIALKAAGAEVARLRALGEWAVVIISNVSEGDWTQEVDEWQDAARKWMDAFHARALAEGDTP